MHKKSVYTVAVKLFQNPAYIKGNNVINVAVASENL
jgi:hypothetical protein